MYFITIKFKKYIAKYHFRSTTWTITKKKNYNK